ncbi:MAG: 4-hydroxythreonine-4-phosphate dehydrogenase PdxA [Candidatus Omnitrophica bacterium]|nr:4-hydroxythreonine-4-phosphate dehydrogenase PdxA [Candidatus Omnitrophota bacterium]
MNPISRSSKIKVGITIGDPSGIGPAITLKALKKLKGFAEFVVIGDKGVLDKVSSIQHLGSSKRFVGLNNVSQDSFSFGQIRAEYGKASVEYLDKALELITEKQIDCLVTCPISKEAVNLAGLKGFLGHTEYLASRTDTSDFIMMLLNRRLKFSLLTRHIPLAKVSGSISNDLIIINAFMAYRALREMFKIGHPRIVFCGLNPHASDNGVIGCEENEVIKPALAILRDKFKLYIDGPLSADAAIYKANRREYDCIITPYHDQALIPLKLSGFDHSVNLTVGLPFVRTSPLHGTAFDIAATPRRADPNSLIEAIKLAVKCALNLKKA